MIHTKFVEGDAVVIQSNLAGQQRLTGSTTKMDDWQSHKFHASGCISFWTDHSDILRFLALLRALRPLSTAK